MLRFLIVAMILGAWPTGALAAGEEAALPAAERAMERLREGVRRLQPTHMKLTQRQALERRRAPDALSILVIGCDFSDSLMVGRDLSQFPGWPEQTRRAQFIPGSDIEIFAAHDSTYFDLQMQRVDDYFSTVSFGRLDLDWDVHGEIINLPRSMGYYGDVDSSDVRVVRMAREVIDAVDATVDFSSYDTLVLVHAGAGQETDILRDSPEQIFSNYLDQEDFEAAFDAGILNAAELSTGEGPVEHVLILPEAESQDSVPSAGLSGFFDLKGVWCFEFGLRLGMLSLADFTPAGRPDSQGIGNYGLMGYGLFTGLGIVPSAPSAINRMLMGWVDPVEIREDASVRLGALNDVGDAVSDTLLVKVPISDREYWLLEYRLQDSDGDLFYGFDDLNGNRVPDYYDDDSAFGGGIPTSTFDPATDVWERELGAEVDYFMSENPARTGDRCMRGGGSGVYIYHVDERVIENALLSGSSAVNGDREHKGVDVEEADGIEDLDSPAPSEYLLGWDNDVFRGEGNDEFGPDTLPSTASADGLATGIRFHSFSRVVADSLPRDMDGNCTGFEYVPAMTFELEFGPAVDGAPSELARHVFDADPALHDARVLDLGTSPTDATPDGAAEIVLAGDAGRVYAFHGDLTEWLDGDADGATVGVLAVANEIDGAPRWLGPPALFDIDDDGHPEVFLTSQDALHIFTVADGSEWRDGDSDPLTVGVAWVPSSGRFVGVPAVVPGQPSGVDVYLTIETDTRVGTARVQFRDRSGGTSGTIRSTPGRSLGGGALVRAGNSTSWILPMEDDEGPVLLRQDLNSPGPSDGVRVEGRISSTPIATVDMIDDGLTVIWVDEEGATRQTFMPNFGGAAFGTGSDVYESGRRGMALEGAASPLAGGPPGGQDQVGSLFARAAGGNLHLLDDGLRSRRGFPYSPRRTSEIAETDTLLASPLLVDVDGNGVTEILWHDASGAVHGVDLEGMALDGYPFQGPAEPAGSPAAADLDGDGDLELVCVGRFDSLIESGTSTDPVQRRAGGEIRIYELEAPAGGNSPWVQGRGTVDNAAAHRPANFVFYEGGASLLEDQLTFHPHPVVGDVVRVRVQLGVGSRVQAVLYTLEGQEVARSAVVDVPNGAAFDEEISVVGLSTGMYVCRISSREDTITAPVAVVR